MHRSLLLFLLVCAITSARSFGQGSETDTLRDLSRKVDILTQEFENMKLGEVVEEPYQAQGGLGPGASRVYRLKKTGVSIAGYGEVAYENYSSKRDDGQDATQRDKIDFLRNVVYFGYRFNDWILFNSEVEFEHASTGGGGEVSVEFGYVELMFARQANLRAGMVLPPVGIINEKHEPSTFLGTLRPQVERMIVPSTWRTNGVGVYGDIMPSLSYRAYVVEGLNAARFGDSDGIRGGRQSGANALAENFGFTGKVEFTGIPGTTLATSFYAGNAGQGSKDSLGRISAMTTLVSVHAEFAWQGVEMRALFAGVTVDEADRVSRLVGKTVGSRMDGWYVVAGYDVIPLIIPGSEHYLAPFVQYEQFNTHKEVAAGFTANKAYDRSILTLGVSYKPHPNVAFKFDYRDNKNAITTAVNQWNVAVNYLY